MRLEERTEAQEEGDHETATATGHQMQHLRHKMRGKQMGSNNRKEVAGVVEVEAGDEEDKTMLADPL
jgi:hypothetical protein